MLAQIFGAETNAKAGLLSLDFDFANPNLGTFDGFYSQIVANYPQYKLKMEMVSHQIHQIKFKFVGLVLMHDQYFEQISLNKEEVELGEAK